MSKAKEYLLNILQGITKKPDEVSVEEFQNGNKTMFYICCNKLDKGRIIGKEGRTIKAVQQVTYSFIKKDSEGNEDSNEVVRMSVDGLNE